MGADRGVHVEIPADTMHLLQPIHVRTLLLPVLGIPDILGADPDPDPRIRTSD
jgi:hypothetical protein